MADSKKIVKRKMNPKNRSVVQNNNPNQFYSQYPSWNFSNCDKEKWSIQSNEAKAIFWEEIFPRFQAWETQKWSEILMKAQKQNHSINTADLNQNAFNRLTELYIEADSLISLRLTGTHRIYGYMNDAIFNVLWVDLTHGDNETCICRSHKKHT